MLLTSRFRFLSSHAPLALLLGAALATASAQAEAPVATPTAAAVTTVAPAPAIDALLKTAQAEMAASQPGDAAAGASKAAACGACHGLDGNSVNPLFPKLAGQHETFIAQQLLQFKAGARVNPLMVAFVAPLSAQDMRDIGAYFATQKIQPGLADDSKISSPLSPYLDQRLVDVGQNLFRGGVSARAVPACMSCHGPTGRGNPGPSYPSIAGQFAAYAAARLNFYRSTKPGDAALTNANFAVMVAIAQRLTDEEVLAISSYLEGLHAAEPAVASATAP